MKVSGIPSGIKLTQTIWHHHMWRYDSVTRKVIILDNIFVLSFGYTFISQSSSAIFGNHRKMFGNVRLFGTILENLRKSLKVVGNLRKIVKSPWLRGFQVKLLYLVLFPFYLSLFWELRDKRNLRICNFDPKASAPCLNIDISDVAYWRQFFMRLSWYSVIMNSVITLSK